MDKKPTYESVLQKAREIEAADRKQRTFVKKIVQKARINSGFSRFIVGSFWLVLMVLVLGSLAYFAYTKKDELAKLATDKIAASLSLIPLPQTATPIPTSVPICSNLVVTNDNGNAKISAVSVGNCYNIAEADRANWKQIFSDGNRVDKYADHIFSESNDKSISKDMIVEAIGKSLKTNILELRKDVPVATLVPTNAPTTAPSATLAPSTPTLSPPTATPTPIVQAVPAPEKEKQLALSDLVQTMKDHNIQLVASNNKSNDFHDKVNWLMWYDVNGGKDYIILNTLDPKLPPQCSDPATTFISVSLKNTGSTGETATKVGSDEVWFICSK